MKPLVGPCDVAMEVAVDPPDPFVVTLRIRAIVIEVYLRKIKISRVVEEFRLDALAY